MMSYGLFDTHAHYTDNRFETEYEGGADELLRTVFTSGVDRIVNVGVDYENSLEVIAQAAKYDGMYAAVGIHPSDCKKCTDIDFEMDRLVSLLEKKDELKIVAIGEIGFDYYWEPIEKEKQYDYFYRQMLLAEKYGLPVVIHDREAHGDTVAMIERLPNVKGILHSCSASAETVKELCKKGWYISFSGTVTFKNAARVKEAAAATPIDKLLSETDCPYLAPHPHRGKLNHSALMSHTAATLAEIHGVSEEIMRENLYKNAKKVFNLD